MKKGIAVNLGAWRGRKTIVLARKYNLVIAVEPVRENYEVLINTIVEKGLNNVIPVFAAISNKSGLGKIYLAKKSQGNSLYFKRRFTSSTTTRSVLTL